MAAFVVMGLTVEDVQREMFGMLPWVLVSDGSLWLHGKPHDGSGQFCLKAKASNAS
jgi:hypothetical protein